MTRKHRGFTLVELLIVIVVIGILSAMMMLSSNEAVTSSKASNIVSNMRNLKTAALSYWADNMDTVKDHSYTAGSSKADDATSDHKIPSYLNNEKDTSLGTNGAYSVVVGDEKTDEWYVKYTFSDLGQKTEMQRVATKLAGRAKSVGLLASAKNSSGEFKGGTTTGSGESATTKYEVYMRVR